jgi:ketosteroid isomerase-like protein
MKNNLKLFSTFCMILTIMLSMSSCQESTETTETTEMKKPATVEELGRMNREFAKALSAKDAAAAANEYDENASILPPNENIITGRANIQAYWQGLIDAGLIDGKVKTIAAASDGDLGYEIGTFELRILGENGDTITDIGKYTEILKRDAEGKWISLYGMWSANE